jgi:hypothetical protein
MSMPIIIIPSGGGAEIHEGVFTVVQGGNVVGAGAARTIVGGQVVAVVTVLETVAPAGTQTALEWWDLVATVGPGIVDYAQWPAFPAGVVDPYYWATFHFVYSGPYTWARLPPPAVPPAAPVVPPVPPLPPTHYAGQGALVKVVTPPPPPGVTWVRHYHTTST